MKIKKLIDRTLVLYVIIGVLNYLFCTALMFLLFNVCGVSEHIAPLVNYGLGSVIWYLACRFILFPTQRTSTEQLLRFVVEIVICYLLSYYLIAPLLSKLLLRSQSVLRFFSFGGETMDMICGNCEMAVGSLVYAILNYFGQRYFVFNAHFEHHRKSQEDEK